MQNSASDAVKSYPSAKFYRDFRVMFDEMASGIDAVSVATPDHFHALAASVAMAHGKHVYCQKPLTQTIYEARYLRDLAHEKKLVTQMGNQGSAADGLRRAVEVHSVGHHRPGEPGSYLDQSPDLAAGHGSSRRFGSGAGFARLGHLARAGAGASLQKRMCINPFVIGAAGRISAPARSATWLVTRSTCPSAP